jgi:ribosomal protein L19
VLPVEEVELVARPTVLPEESVTVLRVVDPLGVERMVPSDRPEASFMRIDVAVPEAVVVARPVVRPEAS